MTVHSLLVHPFDPLGNRIGGISSFLKGYLRFAPDDFDIELVGITTDTVSRPVGRWTEVSLDNGRTFKFLPVGFVEDENRRTAIPLGLSFLKQLWTYRRQISTDGRILQFHRIEPATFFYTANNPRINFVHMNIQDLANKHSEIRWSRARWLYSGLEQFVFGKTNRVYVVNEKGVNYYRSKFAAAADKFQFFSTWVDDTTFYPISDFDRPSLKARLLGSLAIEPDDEILLFIGRLEAPKDPMLMLSAFEILLTHRPRVRLLIIGDGTMRPALEEQVRSRGLTANVRFLGKRKPADIADFARISDFFVLVSAFEGMPISLLEAQACGLPALCTRVGEIERIIRPGESGLVIDDRSPDGVAAVWSNAFNLKQSFTIQRCVDAVEPYTARRVLSRLYAAHYELMGVHS